MNLRRYKIALTVSLILALLIPMGVDGAHFLIFHHHKSTVKTAKTAFYQAENHNICQYEFATEIVDNQNIIVSNISTYFESSVEQKVESPKKTTLLYVSLRAPPTENQS